MSGYGAASSSRISSPSSSSSSSVYSTPYLFINFSPVTARSFVAHFPICRITVSVIGNSVQFLRTIFFPVSSDMNLWLPWMFPVGPRQIAHRVLGSIVFVTTLSSCTSQYAPKGVTACTLASSGCLDTSSLGLNLSDTPDFTGKALSHITQKCSSSITISLGSVVYGNVLIVPLALSLIVLIFRSISPTCSLAAVVFSVMFGSSSLSASNSMSIIPVCTMNPPLEYILITRSTLLASCLAVLDGKYSIVIKLIPREEVTKNGKPLTNITSATIVTYLYISIKLRGTFT